MRHRITLWDVYRIALLATTALVTYPVCLFLDLAFVPIPVVVAVAGLAALVLRGRTRILTLCWIWLLIIMPTFGALPMAGMLQIRFGLYADLRILDNIQLTRVYDLFARTAIVDAEEHPSPPLSYVQWWSMIAATLAISAVVLVVLVRLTRSRGEARDGGTPAPPL
jgi:hypothetical protein